METTTQKKKLSRKQVRETSIGKSVSAWVILRNNGRHVGTVQAAFLDSGSVMVDVWGPHELVHQGKAGGYGYDKFTGALSGAKIDGITIYDHSVGNYRPDEPKYMDLHKLMLLYSHADKHDPKWDERAKAIGARWANYKDGKFTSLYYISGLDRLTEMGYKVIQAI